MNKSVLIMIDISIITLLNIVYRTPRIPFILRMHVAQVPARSSFLDT